MRITRSGISRVGAPFEFTFEGQRIPAHAGETLAAALIAAGHWSFRDARDGAPRGPFCGMGVCGECQVRVNGESRRACHTPAMPGCTVARQPALAPAADPHEPCDAHENWQEITTDVLVVGAGPAGLSAARVAAAGGLDVLVVDERAKAGGQFFKQPGEGFNIDERRLDAQYAEGRRLYAMTRAAGARFLFGAAVWGAFGPGAIALLAQGRTQLVRARRLILATGAYERALAIPGWTLPGFITTGAAQTLLRSSLVAPGRRVLIAGNGPLNLQAAHELAEAGARVVAVVELASPPLRSPLAALGMAISSPALLLEGLSHLAFLHRKHVPIHYRHVLSAVEGTQRVERAVITRLDARNTPIAGSDRSLEVDTVCVNQGFTPQYEVARALGCEFSFDARTLNWNARCDEDGRSSVSGVFVVGDCGGVQGARVAIAQGVLAGARVVSELAPDAPVQPIAPWRRVLRRHQRFQRALWRAFRAPALSIELAHAETPICRCEGVSRGVADAQLAAMESFGAVKRATRLGMGRCQGRYCSTLLAALMSHCRSAAPSAEDFFAPRPPFRPVTAAQAAGETGTEIAEADLLRTTGHNTNALLDRRGTRTS